MNLAGLHKPVDGNTAREFDWSELVWHLGLDPAERRDLHDHLQHLMLVWLFCNAQFEVFPIEPSSAGS